MGGHTDPSAPFFFLFCFLFFFERKSCGWLPLLSRTFHLWSFDPVLFFFNFPFIYSCPSVFFVWFVLSSTSFFFFFSRPFWVMTMAFESKRYQRFKNPGSKSPRHMLKCVWNPTGKKRTNLCIIELWRLKSLFSYLNYYFPFLNIFSQYFFLISRLSNLSCRWA